MKITMVGGVIQATAETLDDSIALLELNDRSGRVKKAPTSVETVKNGKWYNRTCKDCGLVCKGLQGMAIHRSHKHGERSPLFAKKRAEYFKHKAEVEASTRTNLLNVPVNAPF